MKLDQHSVMKGLENNDHYGGKGVYEPEEKTDLGWQQGERGESRRKIERGGINEA